MVDEGRTSSHKRKYCNSEEFHRHKDGGKVVCAIRGGGMESSLPQKGPDFPTSAPPSVTLFGTTCPIV